MESQDDCGAMSPFRKRMRVFDDEGGMKEYSIGALGLCGRDMDEKVSSAGGAMAPSGKAIFWM